MIRPFVPLFFSLVGMFILASALDYRQLEPPAARAELNKLVASISEQRKDYILTFGSSVHDTGNVIPFPVLLEEALRKKKVNIPVRGIIIHGGESQSYYKSLDGLLQAVKKHSMPLPKLIIMEVNPRSFSTQYASGYKDPVYWSSRSGWYSGPPLLSVMKFGWEKWIPPFFLKEELLTFSNKTKRAIFDYYHLQYSDYYKAASIIDLINFTPVVHSIGYKLPLLGSFYGGTISKFLLEDWRELALLAEKNNIPLLFYITPINSNLNSPDATPFYRFSLNRNRQILISSFSTMGAIKAIDLGDLIDTQYFLDCEHLKPAGLQKLAGRVADEVMELSLDKQASTKFTF